MRKTVAGPQGTPHPLGQHLKVLSMHLRRDRMTRERNDFLF